MKTRRCQHAVAAVVGLALVLDPSAAHAEVSDNSLTVSVIDAVTEAPIDGAQIEVSSGDSAVARATTDREGLASFAEMPNHAARLTVRRTAYLTSTIELAPRTAASVEVRLVRDPIDADEVIVIVDREPPAGFQPATAMEGLDLQKHLGSSVPDTLASVPGVAVAFNGPGAAQPTIRGLAGDRVLVLEDGFRTGDLYWSAADHGVMVEPLTAQQISVVRGPASLLFGGNALGGVVDVVRHDIPRQPLERVTGAFTSQVDSTTLGAAQGASVRIPVGPVVARFEESARYSRDVRTPDGPIGNTGLQSYGFAAGASWLPIWGLVGSSVRYHDSEYGVPGEFAGQLIPGGHPGGANIDSRRLTGRFRFLYDGFEDTVVKSVEFSASGTRYLHDEIEGIVGGERAVGALFDLRGVQSKAVARHDSALAGGRWHGSVGVAGSVQDLEAGGNSPGMRSGSDWSTGFFAVEQFDRGRLSLIAGGRLEYRRLTPEDTSDIDVRTSQRTIVKSVSARGTSLASGSLAAVWTIAADWRGGINVARSARAPNLQELYSDGPHLADFSFDIGSPDLSPEIGHGVDLFVRGTSEALSAEFAVFANRIDGFIDYVPTLETIRVFREGQRPRETPVYEAAAVDATFLGAEGAATWRAGAGFHVDATMSFVRAGERGSGEPLPSIAPLRGRVAVRYERGSVFGGLELQAAARQSRVPSAVLIDGTMTLPQQPTDAYALWHARAGWSRRLGELEHAVTVRAFNLTDRLWRDHLSRIKDVAPQSGRGVTVTYRVGY